MILGLDFSTTALHAALIPLEPYNGEPNTIFRTHHIKRTQDPLNRYFQARVAMRELCRDEGDYPVHLVVVEQPMGKFGVRPLWAMFGAIVASIPGVAAVTCLTPQEWRRELGLSPRLTKEAAITAAQDWLREELPFNSTDRAYLGVSYPNEHQAEALLIALAGRQQNIRAWSEGAA